MEQLTDHTWPTDPAQHVWGPWMAGVRAGTPAPPTQYRTCVHPTCGASEHREVPKA